MSESKTRTYEIVSKAMLEKIQLESSNEELLEEVRLEILRNKESARVIQNNFSEQEKSIKRNHKPRKIIEKNETLNQKNKQKPNLLLKKQVKNIQQFEICGFCFTRIVSEKYQTHFEELCPKRPKYFTAKLGWEEQDLDEIPEIARITDQKKLEIRKLTNKIRKMRIQLDSINLNKKLYSRPEMKDLLSFRTDLRNTIQIEIETIDKIIVTRKVYALHNNKLKPDRKYIECQYCSASISEKNHNRHISSKCPKIAHIPKKESSAQIIPNKTSLKIEKVSWTLLPKGKWLFVKLTNHFKHLNSLSKWKNKFPDKTRFQKIEKTLCPNKCFIGKGKFEGYVAYCFDWTNNIILECPIYGNAIYIIKRGKFTWQEIAQASKWEARTEYSAQVKVINHSDTWLERLEQSLRYDF